MMIRKAALASVAVLGLASALSACSGPIHDKSESASATQQQSIVVQETLAPDYRMVAAVMTNRDIGDARARIGGKLTQLLVRDGDSVKKGQVVAVITDDRIDAEARAASAAVTAAKANADRAAQDLARAEKLFTSQAVSRAAVDAARADASAGDANLKAAQAQAAAAQAVKNQGRVTAPADGRVTRAATPQGAVVMPGEVVVAISTGAPVLRIELPEADGSRLNQGDKLPIMTDTADTSDAFATVRQVYPAVTRGRVMADLDAPTVSEGLIGARVRVAVPLGERPAIVIPENYIVTRYGADYVRLKRAGDTFIEAPVQRGAHTPTAEMPNGIEVLSGLRQGDEIIAIGDAS